MKAKLAIAAALLTSVVSIGSSPASAYLRNSSPVIVTVICSLTNDNVYIEWSKDAGKPSTASIAGTLNGTNFSGTYAIPGSRGSKGSWTILPEFFLNTVGPEDLVSGQVRVRLFNRDGSLASSFYPVDSYLACA